jgi:hypothetical protein
MVIARVVNDTPLANRPCLLLAETLINGSSSCSVVYFRTAWCQRWANQAA